MCWRFGLETMSLARRWDYQPQVVAAPLAKAMTMPKMTFAPAPTCWLWAVAHKPVDRSRTGKAAADRRHFF